MTFIAMLTEGAFIPGWSMLTSWCGGRYATLPLPDAGIKVTSQCMKDQALKAASRQRDEESSSNHCLLLLKF